MPSRAIAAIVLAAGCSTRMRARNKLLLPWKGAPMLQAVVDQVLRLGCAEVVVVLGHQAEKLEAALEGRPLRLAFNRRYAEGLAASVAKGVEEVEARAEGYLFVLGDMPRVKGETMRRLCECFARGDAETIVVPLAKGKQGNPVLLGRAYREELLALRGDRGARPVVERHPAKVVELEVDDEGILLDVDTPEAYRAAHPPP